CAEGGDARADGRQGVLGEVDERGPGGPDAEASETRDTGSDGGGDLEGEPGRAGLRRPADDAVAVVGPRGVAEPAVLGVGDVEPAGGAGRQRLDGDRPASHAAMRARAAMTWSRPQTSAPSAAAWYRALSAMVSRA